MATHSSTLAWKIPWTEGPGRLQSMGSLRVGHDWVTSLSLFSFMYWRRKWQPTPVFLPGESQGLGSLVGCRLWGRTESGTTEWLSSSSSSISTTSQKNMEEKNLPCWDILISDLKITHDFFQHQIIYQTGRCSMWKEDIYIQRYIFSMTIFILLSILGASVESGKKVWVGLLNWANLDHSQGKVIHWVSVLHYTSWVVLKSEIVLGLNSASVIY